MPPEAVIDAPTTATPAPAAPSGGSSSAPAAPSTQGSTPAPAASERPKDAASLSALMQKMDATADATTPQPPLVADSAAATTAPPTEPVVPGASLDPTAKTAPPEARWPTILQNARDEAVTQYRQKFGWAESVDQRSFQETANLAKHLSQNTVGFYHWLGEQIRQHPVLSQQLKAAAQPNAPQPAQPDVQIMNDKGEVIGSLSDFLKPVREQLMGEVTQLVKPFQTEREQRLAKDKADAFNQRVKEGSDQVIDRVTKILDGRDDLGPHVNALMAQGLDPIDAALKVRETHIVPGLAAKAAADAVETNRKKAAGNTTVPGAPAPSARPKNAKELAALMESQGM